MVGCASRNLIKTSVYEISQQADDAYAMLLACTGDFGQGLSGGRPPCLVRGGKLACGREFAAVLVMKPGKQKKNLMAVAKFYGKKVTANRLFYVSLYRYVQYIVRALATAMVPTDGDRWL